MGLIADTLTDPRCVSINLHRHLLVIAESVYGNRLLLKMYFSHSIFAGSRHLHNRQTGTSRRENEKSLVEKNHKTYI